MVIVQTTREPQTHMMPPFRTFADFALERQVLFAAEEIEWTHGRGRIGTVEQDTRGDLHARAACHWNGLRPASALQGARDFRRAADERDVHGISSRAAHVRCALRHMSKFGKA